MKEVKDNFSSQSASYASYRPGAPMQLLDSILGNVKNFGTAWDCGTGNGQIAIKLAERFEQVYATDISQKQLDNAPKLENITYLLERAEQTTLPDDAVDLVTIAQAIHWFDFESFYAEVKRVAKDGCLVAAWTYFTPTITPEIDEIIADYYINIIGPYWDKERKYIDEKYQTIPFPFDEFKMPDHALTLRWTAEQLLGYLATWSSAIHYINKNGSDPALLIKDRIYQNWKGDAVKDITFPLAVRIGTVSK